MVRKAAVVMVFMGMAAVSAAALMAGLAIYNGLSALNAILG